MSTWKVYKLVGNSYVSDDYGDEAMASIKFAEEFANRYGRPHPEFFPGTLDDAIKESCIKPAKEVQKKPRG